jgi:hypothetical protein
MLIALTSYSQDRYFESFFYDTELFKLDVVSELDAHILLRDKQSNAIVLIQLPLTSNIDLVKVGVKTCMNRFDSVYNTSKEWEYFRNNVQ